jgi:hypothetical protein
MKPVYVQYGCGASVGGDWLNFDNSLTLRIELLPVVGSVISRRFGNARPFPKLVRRGDVVKGLPVADGTVRAVYISHVLATLSYEDGLAALRNTFRMLEPGGTFRLITPDFAERARRYCEAAAAGSADACGDFLRSSLLGRERRPRGLIARLRASYGAQHNLWMWDEPSLVQQLQRVGFVDIRRCDMGDSGDPMFDQVEEADRFYDANRMIRELALSARKPEQEAKALTGMTTSEHSRSTAAEIAETRPDLACTFAWFKMRN